MNTPAVMLLLSAVIVIPLFTVMLVRSLSHQHLDPRSRI